tara:strand:+ start:782 stop:1681 length:900 start_codon:yes stop_codon:yes gene_type:complete
MNQNNRIFVAGCGGMLGEAIYNNFRTSYELYCTDLNVNDDWIDYLDFRESDKYEKMVINYKPKLLFHIGAYTDLEFCEKHPNDAIETNYNSVKFAVNLCKKNNIKLVFISSAGVFDGKKNIYYDDDLPTPISQYAKTKALSEEYIQSNLSQFLILRPGWMMGGGPKKDKKFVNKIYKQIKNNVQNLNVVNDKLGTPTYTYDFANNLKLLIENNLTGVFNLVCEGETSRLDVAREMLKILKLSDKININEVDSNFFKNEYYAKRPLSERLENRKLNNLNLNVMRNWKICLKEYLNNNYKI